MEKQCLKWVLRDDKELSRCVETRTRLGGQNFSARINYYDNVFSELWVIQEGFGMAGEGWRLRLWQGLGREGHCLLHWRVSFLSCCAGALLSEDPHLCFSYSNMHVGLERHGVEVGLWKQLWVYCNFSRCKVKKGWTSVLTLWGNEKEHEQEWWKNTFIIAKGTIPSVLQTGFNPYVKAEQQVLLFTSIL